MLSSEGEDFGILSAYDAASAPQPATNVEGVLAERAEVADLLLDEPQPPLLGGESADGAADGEGVGFALDDVPQPLTEPQRRAVQRHVGHAVRRHAVVCRTRRLVRRGLASLERLVARLRGERDRLLAPPPPPPPPPPAQPCEPLTKAVRTEQAEADPKSASASSQQQQQQQQAPRRTSLGGALQRSAVFANMQKALRTAQTEGRDKLAQLAEERERIRRQTQLAIVTEDLAAQEAILQPLLDRLARCEAVEAEAERALVPLLELLAEMFVEESRYAASFALSAVDAAAAAAAATAAGAGGETGVAGEGGSAAGALPTASGSYEIPFTPATHSAETAALRRRQVEEALPRYQAYRARIDPVLAELAAAEMARAAKRVDELRDLLGAPAGGATARDVGRRRRVRAGFGVSDSSADSTSDAEHDDDDDQDKAEAGSLGIDSGVVPAVMATSAAGAKRGRDEADPPATADAAASDRQDRHMVQSALSALNDFDELF